MLLIISPAKTLKMEPVEVQLPRSYPYFLEEAQKLVNVLKKYKPAKLAKLMHINPALARLNFERYQEWQPGITTFQSKPAILSFTGEVFRGIDAESFTADDFLFIQDHLFILSGLYGALRPLDLIQPYRLEIGTPLKFSRNRNLYDFWKNKIAKFTMAHMDSQQQKVLVNLASREYFKSIESHLKQTRVITPVFKENRDGVFKFIHTYGKRARGLMTRFVVQNKIREAEKIKMFDLDGYYYNEQLSSTNEWVFTR